MSPKGSLLRLHPTVLGRKRAKTDNDLISQNEICINKYHSTVVIVADSKNLQEMLKNSMVVFKTKNLNN